MGKTGKTKFTNEEKNKILKEVLKKINQYYEEALKKKDLEESEEAINSINNING